MDEIDEMRQDANRSGFETLQRQWLLGRLNKETKCPIRHFALDLNGQVGASWEISQVFSRRTLRVGGMSAHEGCVPSRLI